MLKTEQELFLHPQYLLSFSGPVYHCPLADSRLEGMTDADSLKSLLSLQSAAQRQIGFAAPSFLWSCSPWGPLEALSLSLASDTTGHIVLYRQHCPPCVRNATVSNPFDLSRCSAASFYTCPSSNFFNDSVLLGPFLDPPLYTNMQSSLASTTFLRTVILYHMTFVHIFPGTQVWRILDEALQG